MVCRYGERYELRVGPGRQVYNIKYHSSRPNPEEENMTIIKYGCANDGKDGLLQTRQTLRK